jgi:hypothetical protein
LHLSVPSDEIVFAEWKYRLFIGMRSANLSSIHRRHRSLAATTQELQIDPSSNVVDIRRDAPQLDLFAVVA